MNAIIGAGVGMLAAAGVGFVGYEVWKHNHLKALATGTKTLAPSAPLDAGMDAYTTSVISAALQKETDTTVLDSLAQNLRAAGFPNSAAAVSKRSDVVKSAIKNPAPVTTATKGLATGVMGLFGVGATTCGCAGHVGCECDKTYAGQEVPQEWMFPVY